MRVEKCRYRIGVVSAMWGRLELTDKVFAHIAAMRKAVAPFMELLPAVAGSEGERSRAVAEKNGFAYIEVENRPLGAKWNAALSLLRERDVDGVVILGSDDFLNERFFHVLKRVLDKGCPLAGLDTFFVLEGQSGRLMEWLGYLPPREGESIGAGRFLHRELLDRQNWHLWEDGLNEGLDASMWRLLRKSAAQSGTPFSPVTVNCRAEGIVLTDVKGSTQITGLETLALSSGRIRMIGSPRQFMEEAYGKTLAESLFSHSLPLAENPSSDSPDVLIDALEPFSSPDAKEPPVYVLTPHLPNGVADLADHQFTALLTSLRMQGRRLELWAENPREPFSFKVDSGMTGQRIRGLADAMRDPPPHMRRVVVWGGWRDALLPASVIKRLRRNCAALHVTADLRFSDQTEAKRLADLADVILPGAESSGTDGLLPLCVPERRIPFTDFALRGHSAVFMEHEGAADDGGDIVRACATDAAWQKAGTRLYLSFAGSMPAPAPQWGVHACKGANMQILYRIFKVCIVPPKCVNQGICAEILAAGTPLVCHIDLADKMGLSEEHGVLAFASWKEALSLTRLLCAKREFWTRTAERAWKTGKTLLEASNKAYAALREADG